MSRNFFFIAGAWLLATACGAAAAQSSEEYASNLATLYGERFWTQAYKDVCISVLPKARRDFQGAYEEWLARHQEVVEDLDLRIAALAKGMSRDEAEYQHNYNKYHDAVMRQREENKRNLRALPREGLLKQCKELPAYLRGSDSDLYNTHPKAFNAIYGKVQQ
jgi:hypothetical protein